MKPINYNGDNKILRMTGAKAIEFLNGGHSLTSPGKDLNTLRKKGDNYSYKGLNDTGETILNESEVKSLIKEHNWTIDLL